MTYLEGLLCFLFAIDLLPYSTKKSKYPLITLLPLLSTVTISICNSIALVSQYTVFISVVLFAFLIYIFIYKDVILSVTVSATYVTIILSTEMLFISAISVITKDPDFIFKMLSGENIKRVASILILKSIQFTVYFLSRNRIKNADPNILKTKQYIICIFVSLFMIIGIMGLINQNSINALKIGISLMFMVFIVIILIIINLAGTALKSNQILSEKEYIKLKNRFLENELYYLNELYDKNSKNFHDFNNHISVMTLMLESNNYDELKKYLYKIKFPTKSRRKFNTGNKTIDTVLNIKYTQIEELKIEFNFSYNSLEDINIEPQDISSLLFNLIDNAITASSKTDTRNITLKICVQGNLIIITIINNCPQETTLYEAKKISTKNHGWGIKIIKDITAKYDGEYTATIENSIYKTKIILKNDGSSRENDGSSQ